MSGAEVPLALAVGSSVVSAVGGVYGAYASASALEKQAKQREMQANELLARQAINENIMRENELMMEKQAGAAFAATGRDGGGIGSILRMQKVLQSNLEMSRRDAEFKARLMRMGAESDMALASDQITAGWISGGGSLLNGAYQTYKLKADSDKKTLYGGGTP